MSYVYNLHERQLANHLTGVQHDQHDLAVATMHAHIDHDDCIETAILRGRTNQVVHFAQDAIAETGVRHGHFNPIPVELTRSPPNAAGDLCTRIRTIETNVETTASAPASGLRRVASGYIVLARTRAGIPRYFG